MLKKNLFFAQNNWLLFCGLILAVLIFSLFIFNAVKIKNVQADTASTAVSVGNASPSIGSVSLNGGNDININEGTFKWASTTMTVTDTNGCAEISSVVAKLYRTATSTDGTTCSQNDLSCYIGVGSTTPDECIATTTGNTCDGGADTSVEYDCGFKIWYVADPTDAGTYAGHVWAVSATTTDTSAANGTATNTDETIEIISQNALDVTASIDHTSVSAGSNTGATNQPTTVTTTGNTAIDTEVSGTDMTGAGTITVGNQKYGIANDTYASLTGTLTGSAVTQELDNVKPTATTSPQTDIVYWGLNVPAGTSPGSYSGTNTFGAVSD